MFRSFERDALGIEGFERRALSMYGHTTSDPLADAADKINRQFHELGREFAEMAEKAEKEKERQQNMVTCIVDVDPDQITLSVSVGGVEHKKRARKIELTEAFEKYSLQHITCWIGGTLTGKFKTGSYSIYLTNGGFITVSDITETNQASFGKEDQDRIMENLAQGSIDFSVNGVNFHQTKSAPSVTKNWPQDDDKSFDKSVESIITDAIKDMLAA